MHATACSTGSCDLVVFFLPYLQIYHELAGLQELRFNWRDKVPPYSMTTSLAGAMQHYPDRDLLLAMYHVPQVGLIADMRVCYLHCCFHPTGGSALSCCRRLVGKVMRWLACRRLGNSRSCRLGNCLACAGSSIAAVTDETIPCCCCVLQEFDPACIRDFLEQLTPSRARITWASRVHEQQQQQLPATNGFSLPPPQLTCEAIYGTQYDVQPLPEPWLAAWSNGVQIQGLHLPDVNPFVPDDLSLVGVGGPKEGLPVVLLEDGGVRLWQRTDLRFENPKATIVLDFQVRPPVWLQVHFVALHVLSTAGDA